ncbi:MAG: hypothetical protein J7545_18640, partial [Roseofilum sp. SBFL]
MTDNTPSTARDLGNLSTSRQFNDFVGPSDPNDYYRFNLESNSSFDLKIDGGNYNLGLYRDANNNGQTDAGERIVSLENGSLTSSGLSTSLSNSNSSINGVQTSRKTLNLAGNLGEGNYYLQVYSSGSNASYQLNLGAEATPGSGGTNNIHGTDGDDLLNGTAGNDTIFGYKGNDTINAGSGTDRIDAGDGNNVITVGNGVSFIDAGNGNNIITVGDGVTFIDAGDGNNIITVGHGVKSIDTGNGNDVITVGNGVNSIDTGDGDDTINIGDGFNSQNSVNGGTGYDLAIYDGNYNDYSITIDGTMVTVTGSLGTDTLENIETLQFSDRTVDTLQNNGSNGTDNTLNTALDLGTLDGSRVFNDLVGSTDSDDYYRFDLDTTKDFNLTIEGGQYGFEFYRDVNNNGQIDAGETLLSSDVNGNTITNSSGLSASVVINGSQNSNTNNSGIVNSSVSQNVNLNNSQSGGGSLVNHQSQIQVGANQIVGNNNGGINYSVTQNQNQNNNQNSGGSSSQTVTQTQTQTTGGVNVIVGGNNASTYNKTVTLSGDLEAGDYYLRVYSSGTDASYQLNLNAEGIEPVTPANPAALESQDTTWTVAATADFNADNKDDVLWRNSSGDNQLWIMDGNTVSSTVDLSNSTLEL